MSRITVEQFKKSFLAIILKGNRFPKKRIDQQVLLLTAKPFIDPDLSYSEKGFNEALLNWIEAYGIVIDHVTLRRAMVDEGMVNRDAAGAVYILNPDYQYIDHDPAIHTLDLDQLIREEEDEIERRRQAYQRRQ